MKKKITNYQYKWKLEEAKIKDLVLDINNVRLGTEYKSQDEVINDLFLNVGLMRPTSARWDCPGKRRH